MSTVGAVAGVHNPNSLIAEEHPQRVDIFFQKTMGPYLS